MTDQPAKIKLLFLLDCLQGGGAQRAIINILNNIDKVRYHPVLVVVNIKGEFAHLIDDSVEIIDLRCKSAKTSLMKFVFTVKKIKPDIIFSTLTYMNCLVYVSRMFINKNIRIIMRSSSFESVNIKNESILARLLVGRAYRSADKVVVLTEAMKQDFIDNFKVSQDKIEIIPNMLDFDYIAAKAKEDLSERFFELTPNTPIITGIGRLSHEKGFDILIRAFAEYRKSGSAKLLIIGDGPDKDKLIKLGGELGISKDILFTGFRENPYKYLKKSSLFILPSIWEGFPNALIEAMACGVAVAASDCPSGPSEILTSGLNGVLFESANINELKDVITSVLSDDSYRVDLAHAAFERSKDFSSNRIINIYNELFSVAVLGKKKKILHVITSIKTGGTERFLQDVVLDKEYNYEHHVIFLKEIGQMGNYLKEKNIDVSCAGGFLGLLNKILRFKPDLVHTMLYRANILGRLAAFVCGIPVVSSQRSIDIWKSRILVILDALTMKLCRLIIVNSRATGYILETRERVPKHKIQLVYTGLPDSFFANTRTEPESIVIGFAGRLHYNKGADLLVPFSRRLQQEIPSAKIMIAGDGPLFESLKTELASNCILMGELNNEDIMGFYDNISLLLSLSREESFPRVMLEAAARGVPSIAPEIGGIPEFINQAGGFLYPGHDMDMIIEQIKSYSYSEETTTGIMDTARKFSQSLMIKQIFSAFNSITLN